MLLFIKQIISYYLVVPLVIIFGCYFTIRLKARQLTDLFRGCKQLFSSSKSSNATLSSFTALAAVLGGNLGTGNIAGIAVALTMGGPGALFWMWVMAFLGAILKFLGVYLGVTHRVTTEGDSAYYIGGPMYYLRAAFNSDFVARLFCCFTIFGALTTGNLVQVNSIILPLQTAGLSPLLIGVLIALFVAGVMYGGAKYFSEVAEKVVPLMALIYVGACLVILGMHYQQIPTILNVIINSAFNNTAVASGALGFALSDAIRIGFDRGLFATDAGIGLAPILHAQVDCNDTVEETALSQATVSVVAPLIVMFICLLTGMVLLLTNANQLTSLESTNMCVKAFQIGFGYDIAGHIVIFTLCLFAFTTILTWGYCAEQCVLFIGNDTLLILFRIVFILLIPIGGLFSVKFVWTLADIALNCMLLLNLAGLVILFHRHKLKTKFCLKTY